MIIRGENPEIGVFRSKMLKLGLYFIHYHRSCDERTKRRIEPGALAKNKEVRLPNIFNDEHNL